MIDYNKMRAARVEVGITQKQMAELMGLSENTYNAKECGKRPVNVDEVVTFCKVTGITDPRERALIFLI